MAEEVTPEVLLQFPPGIPSALRKACEDPFDYALGLKSGLVVYFAEARIDGDWVHLSEVRGHTLEGIYDPHDRALSSPFSFERGIDVRLSEIAWVADAPFGS